MYGNRWHDLATAPRREEDAVEQFRKGDKVDRARRLAQFTTQAMLAADAALQRQGLPMTPQIRLEVEQLVTQAVDDDPTILDTRSPGLAEASLTPVAQAARDAVVGAQGGTGAGDSPAAPAASDRAAATPDDAAHNEGTPSDHGLSLAEVRAWF